MPPHDYGDLLRETMMPIAPKGCSNVLLTDGRAEIANDSAIKKALRK
jgi:hypothetical protein